MPELLGFQLWLANRRAHDNPRGDLIRDYKDRLSRGFVDVSPEGGFMGSVQPCYEARREMKRIVREWKREVGVAN